KAVDQLVAARVEADLKITEVGKKLEDAKFINPRATTADILKGLDRAIDQAKTTDPGGQLSAAKKELQLAQDALAQRHSPQEMLALWLPVLSDRGRKDAAEKALADADRVLNGDKSSADAKAEAKALKGIALRNQGKFAEARIALEEAIKDGAGAKDAAWY